MIALSIAKKNFIEFFRNIKSNLIVIILPIIFFVIFGFIFNKSDSQINFPIAIINSERFLNINAEIVKEIKNVNNTDNNPLFIVNNYSSEEEAINSVRGGTNVLLLAIEGEKIIIKGDDRNVYYNSASGVITEIVNNFYNINSNLFEKRNININEESNISPFDLLVPGLIVYGLLIMIPHNASQFTDIVAKKKIFRLFLSHASGKDVIIGYIISLTLLSLFQTFLLFIVAQMFGFKTNANVLEILIIAIPTNLFIVGISLLIGGFVKNVDNATNLGTMLSVVLGFLSGSFIVGIENIMRIGEFMGRQISLNQILPTTLATQSWTQILLYSKHLEDVLLEIIFITIISIIILLAGIYFYNKNQLRRID